MMNFSARSRGLEIALLSSDDDPILVLVRPASPVRSTWPELLVMGLFRVLSQDELKGTAARVAPAFGPAGGGGRMIMIDMIRHYRLT